MNYIAQLLPSQRAVKSEHSHKDKKQKNSLLVSDEKPGQESRQQAEPESPDAEPETSPHEPFEERRSGSERRLKNITRGRWLDSREKQDRRKPVDIYVKI
ncbi:hypothetical protein [Thalassomonas actiniarum]|uniref:Uncharacterized protein n=1 Tax=Thalassomonas actiniarum TaxID=485447 RepID=A0AAE9YUY5_9GAMM|nr:hypothetical protein [Thalassomonas actiniarum]WDE01293.1 hypothetical protein SG35_012020 [Thalassomonas actiniarum]